MIYTCAASTLLAGEPAVLCTPRFQKLADEEGARLKPNPSPTARTLKTTPLFDFFLVYLFLDKQKTDENHAEKTL